MNSKQVDVIVLNYRMREQVRACLASLRQLRGVRRVIVVDNDSDDGCAEMVQEDFPAALFIQTGANLGYTGGNNRGLQAALAAAADYVLILNPDTVVINPDFLTSMVEYLEQSPKIGIAGPRVFLREAGTLQNTVLHAPGLWRNLYHWFLFRLAPERLILSGEAVVEAEVLNGVCLLIRRECLEEIGLFDEEYFMYIEDADMDRRAWQAGWKVCYLPIDSIIHHQKREGYQPDGPVDFLLKRNSVYYLVKNGRWGAAVGFAGLALLVIWGRGLASLDRERWRRSFDFSRRLISAWRSIFRTGRP